MDKDIAKTIIVTFFINLEEGAGTFNMNDIDIKNAKKMVLPTTGQEQFFNYYMYCWRFRN